MKKARFSEQQIAYALRIADGGTPVAERSKSKDVQVLHPFQKACLTPNA